MDKKPKQTLEKLRKDALFMECKNKSVINKLRKNQLEVLIEKCKKKDVDCRYFLQKKIRVNMGERKDRGWTVPQSIAISYSQVKKMYPKCTFSKKKPVVQIKVKKGELHGYSLKLTLSERRKKLDELVSLYGWGNIVKKLNVLYIYNKNNYPSNALKFRRDIKYVQKKYNL